MDFQISKIILWPKNPQHTIRTVAFERGRITLSQDSRGLVNLRSSQSSITVLVRDGAQFRLGSFVRRLAGLELW